MSPVNHVRVRADDVSSLRSLLSDAAAGTPARRVTVRVRRWSAPQPDWSGRLGPLPGVRRHRVELSAGSALVEVALDAARPLRDVIVAILAALTPVRPLPRPVSPDLSVLGVAPAWLPASPNTSMVADRLRRDQDIRAHDVALAADGQQAPPADPDVVGAVLPAGRTGVRLTDRTVVLVDAAVANPIGRDGPYGPDGSRAQVTFAPDGSWSVTGQQRAPVAGGPSGVPLTAEQLAAATRGVGQLDCAAPPAQAPVAEATLLVQLAATGAVLRVAGLPAVVSDLLSPALRELLAAPEPVEAIEWEIRSVRQRAAALRGHAAGLALPAVAGAAVPSVSALLVTRRAEYVAAVVRQIADQSYPELEIVLCLHGTELEAALLAEVRRCGRPVEILSVPATMSFGAALGAATGRARGSLVTKFDDDDGYGPEHVWDLVLAREYSGATLVGKAAQFVHLQALGVTVRRPAARPESYGAPVAGGTMLIGRGDLEEIGGWRPVPRSVDRGLMDRVARAGGLVYRTHALGYVYERRSGGHTWDAGTDYFLRRAGQQWHGRPPYPEFGGGGGADRVALAGPAPTAAGVHRG